MRLPQFVVRAEPMIQVTDESRGPDEVSLTISASFAKPNAVRWFDRALGSSLEWDEQFLLDPAVRRRFRRPALSPA